MKRYLFSVSIILSFNSLLFSQKATPAAGMVSSKGNFTQLTSRPTSNVSSELANASSDRAKKHPDFGVLPLNAPSKNCYELVDRRTETSRYFIVNGTNGNTFYTQQARGAINYKDKNGYYREKDIDIYATDKPGVFASNNQAEPISIDLNAKSIAIKDVNNIDIKMNSGLELWGVDKEGNEKLISIADWAGATVGSSGLRVNDLFKGISMEAFALSGSVKTNFFIDSYSASFNQFKWLVIKDNIDAGKNNSFQFTGASDASGLYNSDADIISSTNSLIAKVHQGTIFDHSRGSTSALYYKYRGGKFEMYIDVDYLKNSSTTYPVTVDPLVTTSATLAQASITGSMYNTSCNFTNSCDYNLIVNSPANATITDVTFSMSYQALGACYEQDGAMRVGYNGCISPSTTGYYWFCNLIGGGTCNGTNISIFSDISTCIPAPSCTPYPMTFTLKLYRSCWGATGCANGCIQAASPFVVNVMGQTVQTLGNTTTGNGVATQAASCSGTITLNPASLYGVGPYTYTWSPGGANTPLYIATVTATQVFTCNVTDACGVVRAATFTVSANPATPSVTALPAQTLTACAPNATFAPSYTPAGTITAYSWTGPGITGASNGANVVVNSAGTYVLTFTNSAGCTATNSYTAVNGPPATTASAVSSTINCINTTATITPVYTPAGSLTYTWAPVGPGTISGSANNPAVIVSQPGIYHVTTTNTVSGCQNVFTYTVTDATQTPTISSIAAQSITCTTPTVTINPTYNPSTGLSYSWVGPGLSASSASVSVTQGGTFTVTATAANGCSAAAQYSVIDNSALPSVTIQGGTLTCSGPVTLSTTVNPSSGSYTYTWTGSGITSGANSSTVNVNAASIYSVSITNAYGCNATNSFSVAGNTNIPTASAVSATINCINTTATLSPVYTPSNDLTYSWTTVGPGTISGSSTNSNVVASQPGVYQVSFTNTVTNCQSSNTYTVTDATQAPVISSIATQTITCITHSVNISPTYTPSAGLSYSWSGPGLTSSSASVSVTQGGTFTVTATAATGCSATTQYSVIDNSALPTVSIQGGTLTCSGPVTLSTTINPVSGTYTYTWTGPGIVSGGNTASAGINAAGVYSINITNAYGCSATASYSVAANANIPTASAVSVSITCINPTATISPVYNPTSGLTYSWVPVGPGAIAGSNTNASVVVSQPGVYQVTMTNSATNCQSSNTYTVFNNTQVPVISSISTQTITCATPVISISPSYTPATGISYSWTGPGLTPPVISPGISTSQAGTFTVLATTANGCTATAQYSVLSNTTSIAAVAQNTILPCNSDPAMLNVSVNPPGTYTYVWSGPGVVTGGNSATPNVNVSGSYTVLVTDANGCSASAVVNVSSSAVTAAFTPTATSGSAPFDVNFVNQSTGTVSFQWTFGDGKESTLEDPSNTYQTQGTYTVILVASNGTCSATSKGVITVEDDNSMIEVPNVFTPNGDNANDIFTVMTKGMKELELTIYNRWGEKLNSSSGINASWNGMQNGKAVTEGTYFYVVKATGNDGKNYEKKGSVNLFR